MKEDAPVDTPVARQVWHGLETINAVTYFSPECLAASEELGLKGFWMGYFACRSAPFGPVGPGAVEAAFFSFHPSRVTRALPDAWTYASPAEVLESRAASAAAALRRLLPDADHVAARALPLLEPAIAAASPAGRPLFAANRDVTRPEDPVAALWQATTTLREHRGDSHVALLTAAGLDGCEALVLFAETEGMPPELFQKSRGWSPDDWSAAEDRLRSRRVDAHAVRHEIERRTDELAIEPYRDIDINELRRVLAAAREQIASAGDITFPNPMGLPAPA
jgi:hypothetical protein